MPTTTFIWDEHSCLAEADGSNTITVVYTNEPVLYGILISSRTSGTPSYYQFDALGAARQLSASAGTITDTALYDSWGNLLQRTGITVTPYLWVGECGYYSDPETGAISVRQRSYSPTIGRWTSADPLAYLYSFIAYPYVHNSPFGLTDPSGLAPGDALVRAVISELSDFFIGVDFSNSQCKGITPLLPLTCSWCGNGTFSTTWTGKVTVNAFGCDALEWIQAPYAYIIDKLVDALNKAGEPINIKSRCLPLVCSRCCKKKQVARKGKCHLEADIPYDALADLVTSGIWGKLKRGLGGLFSQIPKPLLALFLRSNGALLLGQLFNCKLIITLDSVHTLEGNAIGHCK